MLADTHAHLDFTDDVGGWIERAKNNGVNKIICVGTSVDASKKCVEIAEKYSSDELSIFATCGIHPEDGRSDIKKIGSLLHCFETLKEIAQSSKKVVAIGETGLNYYLETKGQRLETSENERKFQRKLFEVQVGLAAELKLPLIVHCRNGWDEIFDLLSSNSQKLKAGGLFHSWTGHWEAAQKALDLGFYISFSGIVTFKNAPAVREVAAKVPLERMLLETDSPFLAPHPLRGSKNEPKNVKIIAEFIARLRDLPIDRLADVTSRNAGRLFGI